jgi:hypothetical protein
MQKVAGSALLADVFREMGYQKATEFYMSTGPRMLGSARCPA